MINPPTDSLYKFIAISGVVMLLWGAAFPWGKAHELKLQSIDLAAKIELVSQQSEQLKIKYDKLKAERNSLDVNAEDYEIKKEAIKAQKAKLYIQMLEEQLPINSEGKKLSAMVEAQNIYTAVGWGSVIFGVIFVIVGFGTWYYKIQRHLDKKITFEE